MEKIDGKLGYRVKTNIICHIAIRRNTFSISFTQRNVSQLKEFFPR